MVPVQKARSDDWGRHRHPHAQRGRGTAAVVALARSARTAAGGGAGSGWRQRRRFRRAIAEAAGLLVVRHNTRGRAAAINRGVQEAMAPIICVLHADSLLPDDAVAVMRRVLADPGTALAGFTPLLSGPDRVRWGTSFHNWIKTWYAPLLFRPLLFLRGLRLLFGDHAMFFRRADFLAVGGCDPTLLVMEEADLCIRFHRLGRTRLVNRVVITSDRRVAAWGALRANWIYFKVGPGDLAVRVTH
jgi:GT2 family glycosyltransferase